MDYLYVTYKSDDNAEVFTAWFDGTKWNGNLPISSQTGSINVQCQNPPVTVMLNNRLYVIYDDFDSNTCCAWYDGSKWNGGIPISSMNGGINPRSRGYKTAAVFKGLLYLFYIDSGSEDLNCAWFDGTTWYGNTAIKSQRGGIAPRPMNAPGVAVYKDKLYLVYNSYFGSCVAWFDGIQWYGNVPVSSQPGNIDPEFAYRPAVAWFGDKLFLAYSGMSCDLYTCTFDGNTWAGNTRIADQPGGIKPATIDCAGISVFGDKLYLSYVGYFNRNQDVFDLYTCYFDGAAWVGGTGINSQPGGISPKSVFGPSLNTTYTLPESLSQWMRSLPDNILISEINLPGTHDSAAISAYSKTPFACQNISVIDQLRYGIRLLDVRLKMITDGANFSFVTCHGDTSINEYQGFPSLMDECKSFLSTYPSETIVMSLKVDDWYNSGSNQPNALNALKTLLHTYPVTTSASLQKLMDVRGKIVLFNRINLDLELGTPISLPDNTEGANLNNSTNRYFSVYVQDKYQGLSTFGSVDEKLGLVTDAFQKKVPGNVVWNFASAVWYGLFGVYIMGALLGYFGNNVAAARPANFGWILFDYPFNGYKTAKYGQINIVQLIVSSNFHYLDFPDKFWVYTG